MNCGPSSVLKISGFSYLRRASSMPSMPNSLSRVLATLKVKILGLHGGRHRYQVHEFPNHGDISAVSRLHPIGTINRQIPEQIGIDLVIKVRTRGPGFRENRLQPRDPRETLNPFSVYFSAHPPQMIPPGPAAPSVVLQKLLVDEPHEHRCYQPSGTTTWTLRS